MKQHIEFRGETFEYTLKSSKRARRMRLTVHGDGKVVVTMPRARSKRIAQRFVIKHAQWILDRIRYLKKNPVSMLLKNNKRDFLKYKEDARMRVQERLAHFNQIYNVAVNAVFIRNQKTRWGSCSQSGNLNFNYRIALLPEHLADYVIVHEMCHLKELNHSKQFWHLVALTVPNHIAVRKELKRM